jgi:hypothetical protein
VSSSASVEIHCVRSLVVITDRCRQTSLASAKQMVMDGLSHLAVGVQTFLSLDVCLCFQMQVGTCVSAHNPCDCDVRSNQLHAEEHNDSIRGSCTSCKLLDRTLARSRAMLLHAVAKSTVGQLYVRRAARCVSRLAAQITLQSAQQPIEFVLLAFAAWRMHMLTAC